MLFQKLRRWSLISIALLTTVLWLGQTAPATAASAYYVRHGIPTFPPTTCSSTGNQISGPFDFNVKAGMTYNMVLYHNGIQAGPFTGPYVSDSSGSGTYVWGWSYAAESYPYPVQWIFTLKSANGTPLTRTTWSFTCAGAGVITNLVVTNVDLTIKNASLNFDDGRCNQELWQSVAVYPDHKGGYSFYALYHGVGYYALTLTKAELDTKPDKGANYLIAQSLGVRVYRLAGGKLQVNRVTPDLREYAFILSACG